MHTYIAIFHDQTLEPYSPLIGLLERLLGQRLACGVAVRNIALVPHPLESSCLVFAEAPSAAQLEGFLALIGFKIDTLVKGDSRDWLQHIDVVSHATTTDDVTARIISRRRLRRRDAGRYSHRQ